MLLVHNHQTRCADALRQLRISDDTRQLFMQYFDSGMSPAAAMTLHESKLMVRMVYCQFPVSA